MQMVPVSAKGFGNFFEGDCYIVLYVSTILADFPRDHNIDEGMSCMHALIVCVCTSVSLEVRTDLCLLPCSSLDK